MDRKIKNGLQKVREDRNLSIAELASMLKVEMSAIQSWELGAEFPHPSLMKKICHILNTSSETILFNEERTPLNISRLTREQQLIVIDLYNNLKNR